MTPGLIFNASSKGGEVQAAIDAATLAAPEVKGWAALCECPGLTLLALALGNGP